MPFFSQNADNPLLKKKDNFIQSSFDIVKYGAKKLDLSNGFFRCCTCQKLPGDVEKYQFSFYFCFLIPVVQKKLLFLSEVSIKIMQYKCRNL